MVVILRWFRRNDGRFFAYYLMHDYAFAASDRGANPPELEARMAEFTAQIATALQDDVQEVLVVGHSSGASLAVSIVADLLRDGRVRGAAPELSLLTLGQVVPMVSFLPNAHRLRSDLHDLAAQQAVPWVDVTAPGDGCAFALCDPVSVSGQATADKRWPLVFSAAFTQSLTPARWAALRWRFFRLHFQYLCAFDRPRDYDYFQITAGPMTPWRALRWARAVAIADRNAGEHKYTSRDRMTLPPKPPNRADGRVASGATCGCFGATSCRHSPNGFIARGWPSFARRFSAAFMANDPDLVREVLKDRPRDFPKVQPDWRRVAPAAGQFGLSDQWREWERQRRIIDPAFEGGRLRETFPAMCGRLRQPWRGCGSHVGQPGVEIEAETSHAAADVIFRTLFSLPIEDTTARAVFEAFRAHQRSQPILNLAAFVPLPRWVPRGHRRKTKATAAVIRGLITQMTHTRMQQIADGTAPDDLATKIMTTPDPETGACFSAEEMVDQVAIFFLAGHETSASALSWALYLLALYPDWQARVAAEVANAPLNGTADVAALRVTRDVFRETLRLYPPVPMMVREAAGEEVFRKRRVPRGAQIVLSPWHLHRHQRLWDDPDGFDPGRWSTENGQACARDAFIPFSAGPRVCPGAGFAMIEGPLILAHLMRTYRVERIEGREPEPQAHLTVRARGGIWLRIVRR